MRVICKQCPELQVYDLDVRFHKGEASVEDEEVLAKLRSMESFAFEFCEDISEPEPVGEKKCAEAKMM